MPHTLRTKCSRGVGSSSPPCGCSRGVGSPSSPCVPKVAPPAPVPTPGACLVSSRRASRRSPRFSPRRTRGDRSGSGPPPLPTPATAAGECKVHAQVIGREERATCMHRS